MHSWRWRSIASAISGLLIVVAGSCSSSRSAEPAPTIPPIVAPTTVAVTAAASAPVPPTTNGPAAASDPGAAATSPGAGATVAAATPSAAASTLAPISPEQWAAVDTALRDRLLGNGDFAFSLAVSVDGVPVHAVAYGIRNSPDMVLPPPETPVDTGASVAPELTTTTSTTTTVAGPPPEQVDATDRFRIASISKMITGTVVLQLVADGTLGLDQAVGGAIATELGVDVAGQPAEAITVRQLLSHTSGFGVFQRTFFERGAESCPEAAGRGFSNGLQFTPGTTYKYSNMNFCVLQVLIELATGEPYEQVVNERLLAPLGISGMRLAGTFDPHPDEVIHPSFPGRNYMEVLGGAGAWTATPAQVVTIVDSLDNSKPGWHPLPPELSELMRQPVAGIEYNDPLAQWYGLATIVNANRSWGHTGTIENTHAIVMHRPDGMTWALFISGNEPEETGDLVDIFQAALDQSGIDAPAPTTSTTTTTTTTTVPAPTTLVGETTTSTPG